PPGSPRVGTPRRPGAAERRAGGRPRDRAAPRLPPSRPWSSVERDPHAELDHAVLHGLWHGQPAARDVAIVAEKEVPDRRERDVGPARYVLAGGRAPAA